MSTPASMSSTNVKLVAYVEGTEGGPSQVPLTIVAKPTWQMRQVYDTLVQQYERYLAESYHAFSQAYAINEFRSFPPKPDFHLTDHVSKVLESSKGLGGTHIYATIRTVEKGKETRITPLISRKFPAIDSSNGSHKRTVHNSSLAALRIPSSQQNKTPSRPPAGKSKRPTKAVPQRGFSSSRKNAPRKDIYEVDTDSDIDFTDDDDFLHSGPNPKRARTDAGSCRTTQPATLLRPVNSTPTSAQFESPMIQHTPIVAHNPLSRQSKGSPSFDHPVRIGSAWTTRENELMMAEIIRNGSETPTATLKQTLFPGRTTEGIRKRRKKLQHEHAEEIRRRRLDSGLPSMKTPSSSRTKTPGLPLSSQRRDSSPCISINAVDDPSQHKLEIRPGGAVRLKGKDDGRYLTPNSSQPPRKETTSSVSVEPVSVENQAPENNDVGYPPDGPEQSEGSMDWSQQDEPDVEITESVSKFLQDAQVAATSAGSEAENLVRQKQIENPANGEQTVSTGSNSPSPNVASSHSAKRTSSPEVDISTKGVTPVVTPSTTIVPSKLDNISSASQSSVDAQIACTKSSNVRRGSSVWPEDTPIAKFAIVNAEYLNAALNSSTTKSVAQLCRSPSSKIAGDCQSRVNLYQSKETDDAEGAKFSRPGQTPRSLNFKARTPCSLPKSIVKLGTDNATSHAALRESCESDSNSDSSDSSDEANDRSVDVGVESGSDVSSVSSHESDYDSTSSEDSSEEEEEDENETKSTTQIAANRPNNQNLHSDQEGLESQREDIDDFLADQQLRSNAGLLDIPQNCRTNTSAQDLRESSVASEEDYDGGEDSDDEETMEASISQRSKIGLKTRLENIRESSLEEGSESDEEDENTLRIPVSRRTTQEPIDAPISDATKSHAKVISGKPSMEMDREKKNTLYQVIDAQSKIQEERDESYVAFHTKMLCMGDTLTNEMATLFHTK